MRTSYLTVGLNLPSDCKIEKFCHKLFFVPTWVKTDSNSVTVLTKAGPERGSQALIFTLSDRAILGLCSTGEHSLHVHNKTFLGMVQGISWLSDKKANLLSLFPG